MAEPFSIRNRFDSEKASMDTFRISIGMFLFYSIPPSSLPETYGESIPNDLLKYIYDHKPFSHLQQQWLHRRDEV